MKEQSTPRNQEMLTLKNWHLKILILAGIVTPTISVTGAYYKIQEKITDGKTEMAERVSKLELDANKTYADKVSLQTLDTRTQTMQNDITEIKTIIKSKLR